MKQKPGKILVVQTAFIGDAILATSVVETLALAFPEAGIDMLVRKGNEGLLKNNPHLNKVLIWDKKQGKYRGIIQLLNQVRKKKYDLLVNLQRFGTTGFLTAFSGARYKAGFRENPFSWAFDKKISHDTSSGLHEIERNHQLIAEITGIDKPMRPRLYPSEEDFLSVRDYQSGDYICIAPTSVWFTKQFPARKWIAFIETVPDDVNIFLLGGPDDEAACENIVKQSGRKVINLAGKLGFLQSAALMKNALMNYVNDSAPMHIASSMNAPVTTVYCSTVPGFGFGPLSDLSEIVETEKNLHCRPCGLHGRKSCPEGHFECAESIHLEWPVR